MVEHEHTVEAELLGPTSGVEGGGVVAKRRQRDPDPHRPPPSASASPETRPVVSGHVDPVAVVPARHHRGTDGPGPLAQRGRAGSLTSGR